MSPLCTIYCAYAILVHIPTTTDHTLRNTIFQHTIPHHITYNIQHTTACTRITRYLYTQKYYTRITMVTINNEFDSCLKVAQQSDLEAQYIVGTYFISGNYVEKNYQKATIQ